MVASQTYSKTNYPIIPQKIKSASKVYYKAHSNEINEARYRSMSKMRNTKGRWVLNSPSSKRKNSSDGKSKPKSMGINVTVTCPIYLSLAESAEQLLCLVCTSQQQLETILELQGNDQALTTELLEHKAIVGTLQKASNHAGGGKTRACGSDNSRTSSESAAVGGKKLPWNIMASRGCKRSRKTSGKCNSSRVL